MITHFELHFSLQDYGFADNLSRPIVCEKVSTRLHPQGKGGPEGFFCVGTLIPQIRIHHVFLCNQHVFEQTQSWNKNESRKSLFNSYQLPSTHVLSFWWFKPKFTEKPRISRFLPRICWFLASAHGTDVRTDGRSDVRTGYFMSLPTQKAPSGQ